MNKVGLIISNCLKLVAIASMISITYLFYLTSLNGRFINMGTSANIIDTRNGKVYKCNSPFPPIDKSSINTLSY
jgi:hypothetical protein